MGGDITARSEYGRGSVFVATLTQIVAERRPMGDMAAASARRTDEQRITFTAPEAEVLVADDFPSNLLVTEGLLAPYRMRVFTCRNGREAVELARERPFDLILMDHMMPEMDGMEATRAVRAMSAEYCRTMPVVALTANAVSGMREMFLENGFNDFLAKPIDMAELDAVLKKWIPAGKRRSISEESEKTPEPAAGPEAAFPEIAGVDVAAGIARLGGSPDLYLELLETFRRDAEACLAALEKDPDQASLPPFITLAHSLKSALANIGATGLSQAAASLEKAGRNGEMSAVRGGLPPFRESLAVLTARIAKLPESYGSGDGGEQCGPELEETLIRLREALESGDYRAADDTLARLRSLPLTGKMRRTVSGIEDFILLAEFRKAADAVAALLECPSGRR